MTPREANYHSHSQPLPHCKSGGQPSTVRLPTQQHFDERGFVSNSNNPLIPATSRADSSNAKFDQRQIDALVFAALCAVSPFAFAVICLSIYRLVMA
jgi:hypothetical protein